MGEERSLVLDGSSHTLYKLRPQQQRLRISTFTINVTVQSDGSIFTVNAENNVSEMYIDPISISCV